MRRKKSKKGKPLRKRLAAGSTVTCFYCGLPFGAFILPKGGPGAAKSRQFACITLAHIVARSFGGKTTKENCVLAHGWCNSTASNMPLADKLLLKQTLSNNNGLPPWWPLLQKIIANQIV